MKPFFKWAGGKTKELPKIKQYLPKTINTYYEPFVGGGAAWLDIKHTPSVINDKWLDIYNFYTQLKDNNTELISKLKSIITEYNSFHFDGITKEQFSASAGGLYYYWRNTEFDNNVDKAIQFWILRQLSFSGMNRFNEKGEYNVPFGWYKKLREIEWNDDYENLFKNTTILNVDFNECVNNAGKDDFVFLPHISNRDRAMKIMSSQFNEVLKYADLKNSSSGEPRTLYSLRHTAIMFRLTKGDHIDLLTLARNARTSVDMIERFYAKPLSAEMNVDKLQSMRSKR